MGETGSKLVIAAVGPRRFELATAIPRDLRLPEGFRNPIVALPGVLAIEGPSCESPAMTREGASDEVIRQQRERIAAEIERFCAAGRSDDPIGRFRWIVIVDDSRFVAESLRNFLWVTFTRANPAADWRRQGSLNANKIFAKRLDRVIRQPFIKFILRGLSRENFEP